MRAIESLRSHRPTASTSKPATSENRNAGPPLRACFRLRRSNQRSDGARERTIHSQQQRRSPDPESFRQSTGHALIDSDHSVDDIRSSRHQPRTPRHGTQTDPSPVGSIKPEFASGKEATKHAQLKILLLILNAIDETKTKNFRTSELQQRQPSIVMKAKRRLNSRGIVLQRYVWFQRGSAADGNGESTVKIRHCPAAVMLPP